MKVNFENYEVLLLDLAEGRLDAGNARALRAFIDQHPELGKWDELTSGFPLIVAEEAKYPCKEQLLVPEVVPFMMIDENNYDEFFLAWHEGLLGKDERIAVEQFLSLNPSLKSEFQLAGMVYLEPDHKVAYPDKNQLIRKSPVRILITSRIMRYAAAVIILLGIAFWWLMQKPHKELNSSMVVEKTESGKIEQVISEKTENEQPEPQTNPKNVGFAANLSTLAEQPTHESKLPKHSRFEVLPSMTKKAANAIELNSWGLDVAAHDDLQTRLLIAGFIESEPELPDRTLINSLSKVGAGLGKRIVTLHRVNENLSVENLLSAGVGIYNMLTDNDVELVREYESGQLQALMLQSDRVGLRKTLP